MNYILVLWPESQEFMDEEWFESEAHLALNPNELFGGSAYFIPEERIINNEYIIQRVEELASQLETIKKDEDDVMNQTTWNAILNIKYNQ